MAAPDLAWAESGAVVARRMDRMYRPQKLIYDATRKYYLLGRDRLIDRLGAEPGQSVLEIGCGTGRNLVLLARRYPKARLFGIEPAPAMLEAAATALIRRGLDHHVRLAQGIAETLDPAADFGLERGVDHILLSYTLSMMQDPALAIRRALTCLAPGGTLHIADFGDGQGLPRWAGRLLRAWLARFEVQPRSDARDLLAQLAGRGQGRLEGSVIAGGYAELMTFRPAARG